MKLSGAIFDMDGTLLDSMSVWDTIGETYLRSLGYEPKENLNAVFKNMSLYQAVNYYREEYGVTQSAEELMAGVNAMLEHFYGREAPVKPGINRFLQKLQENGVKMCVATATDLHLVEMALERCQIRQYFSGIFTCTQVGCGKDKPEIYRKACEHLNTPKSGTLVFEDAFYALQTARADGFLTAAVYDSHEENQAELVQTADFYLPNYLDFDSFWKSLSQRH